MVGVSELCLCLPLLCCPSDEARPLGLLWGWAGNERLEGGEERRVSVKQYLLLNKSERLPAACHSKYAC